MEKHVFLTFKEVYDILHKLMPNNNEHWNTLSNILGIKISKDPFFKLYNLKTQRMNLDAKLPDGFDANLCSENLSKLLGNKKDDDINNAYNSLKALIRNAENVNDAQKQSWLTSKTYPTFEKLFCNVIYKLMQDGKNYHTNEVITYYDQLPKTTQSSEDKLNIFLNQLLLISEHNYNSIEDADQRFHVSSIDTDLLSFGTYVDNTGKTITDLLSTSFKGCDNNLIIEGDGGIGKTTFLVNTFKNYKPIHSSARKWKYQTYIPFYISLASLKHLDHDADISNLQPSLILDAITERATTMFQHGLFENYKYDEKVFQKQLREYLRNCSNKLKVLLLLDGFNEISLSCEGILRDKIASDIEKLSTYTNVRIVVTSRTIPQSKHLQLANKLHITATGIPKDKITSILTKNNITNVSDENLLNILQTPLFLQMFISTYSSETPVASSRGSILYNYYNRPVSENKNYYSETLIHDYINKKLDSTAPSYMPIVMDFILPTIAFQMVMDDTHEITINQCFNIIDDLELLVKPFENERSKFSHYNKALNRIIKYVKDTPDSVDIIKELLYRVNVLYQPENLSHTECFSFTHHFIRDYFASIFMLNAYLIAPIKLSSYAYYNKLHSFSIDLTLDLLMNEILHTESAYGDESSLLEYAKLSSKLSAHTLSVNNTLTLLSVYMNSDFSSLNFDGIDLSQYSLYNINCHNSESQASTTFKNCTISFQTFNQIPDNIYHLTQDFFLNQKLCHADLYINDFTCKLLLKDILTQTIISSHTINIDFETYNSIDFTLKDFKVSDDGKIITLIYYNQDNLYTLSIKLKPNPNLTNESVCFIYPLTNSYDMYHFEYLSSTTALLILPGEYIRILDLNTPALSYTMPCDIDILKKNDDADLDHYSIQKLSSTQIVANFSYLINSLEKEDDFLLYEYFYIIDIKEKIITNITPSEFKLIFEYDYILNKDITNSGIFINYINFFIYYIFSTHKWSIIDNPHFKNTDYSSCIFDCFFNINSKLFLFDSTSYFVYDLDKNSLIMQKPHPITDSICITMHNDKYVLFGLEFEDRFVLHIDTLEFNILPYPLVMGPFPLAINNECLIAFYLNGSIYKLDIHSLMTIDSYVEKISNNIIHYACSQDSRFLFYITGDSSSKSDYKINVYNLSSGITKILSSMLPTLSCACFSKDGEELYVLSNENLYILMPSNILNTTTTFNYCLNLKTLNIIFDSIIEADTYNPAFFVDVLEDGYCKTYCFEILKKESNYGICYYEIPDAVNYLCLPDIILRQTKAKHIYSLSSKTIDPSKLSIKKYTMWLTPKNSLEEACTSDMEQIYVKIMTPYNFEYILHPDYPHIKISHNATSSKDAQLFLNDNNNLEPPKIYNIGSNYYHFNIYDNTLLYGLNTCDNIFIHDLKKDTVITSNIYHGINISECNFINCTYIDECQEIIKNMNGKIIE